MSIMIGASSADSTISIRSESDEPESAPPRRAPAFAVEAA